MTCSGFHRKYTKKVMLSCVVIVAAALLVFMKTVVYLGSPRMLNYSSMLAPQACLRITNIGTDDPQAFEPPYGRAQGTTAMQYLDAIQRRGVTVLCSLHFLDLVQAYAERAIALNEGKLMFDGDPGDIDDARFKDIYGQEAERIG